MKQSPRLPSNVRGEWINRFAAAETPHQLDELQDQVRAAFGYVFDGFPRNAWIASSFAKSRAIERLRLNFDEWPDFFLFEGDVEKGYEATEADYPNRRRDAE